MQLRDIPRTRYTNVKLRQQIPHRIPLSASSGALTAKPPDIPIIIILEHVFVADTHEGFGMGKGEFYWSAIIADGEKIYLNDSKKVGMGRGGYKALWKLIPSWMFLVFLYSVNKKHHHAVRFQWVSDF